MDEGRNGSGRRWLVAALVVLAVLAFGWSVLAAMFTCFMVTDPECQARASSSVTVGLVVGIGLIVAALAGALRR